jgi:predicted house-cleaning NTP pyrophosphatase (Maf/HAM1 superfamily)
MLVLASNSPRRKDLLALTGCSFSVLPARVDERVLPEERPGVYVRRMARNKAQETSRLLRTPTRPGTLVIAADTAVIDGAGDAAKSSMGDKGGVYLDSRDMQEIILGKPADAVEAELVLSRLRGRTHQVYTAVAVYDVGADRLIEDLCVTDVPMRMYSKEEMRTYIATGDPLDKAGAYAIQHPGFNPVQNLQGCYANVMGLPLCHLTRLLCEFNVHPGVDVPIVCQESLGFTCRIFHQVLDEKMDYESP